ncbi:MAG: carboxypeptidase-like regulatory domain-containing protein [Acidobacteriota bacterium]|nr:carboxypeptidase-like regulatory domain-containing protein [Acidobacteriota bacterium]
MPHVTTASLVILTAFISLARAQSLYCALEVKVSTPSGSPVAGAHVAMLRGDKSTFSETTTAANGVARLCDAPMETVNIVAGFDVCGSVLIRALNPKWPETLRAYVTYLDYPCSHFVPPPICQVLLRIQDEAGHPVAGARFNGKPATSSGSDESDVLGRLFSSLKWRKKLEGVVSKEGSAPAHISVVCDSDVELKVVLHKR